MATLHLGVNDIPYADLGSGQNRGVTTGDVAQFLEDDYGVMGVFYRQHEYEIAQRLMQSAANAFEAVVMGAPPTLDPWGAATSFIVEQFNKDIDSKAFDHMIPGVPTKASLAGTSARKKRPYSKFVKKGSKKLRGPRPSFQFSGLYEDSFTAWVD